MLILEDSLHQFLFELIICDESVPPLIQSGIDDGVVMIWIDFECLLPIFFSDVASSLEE